MTRGSEDVPIIRMTEFEMCRLCKMRYLGDTTLDTLIYGSAKYTCVISYN